MVDFKNIVISLSCPSSRHNGLRYNVRYTLTSIDGQVRLVCLVRLKMDNFRLHNEQTANRSRKIAWDSVFCFPFETATYMYVFMYLYVQYLFI
jgi:hypothetical protein